MANDARARETFLGLDIGTSSVKALLVDAEQRVVAEATAGLELSRPHPLWSEQSPEDWIEGVEAAVATIRRHAPQAFAGLSGIGLSGQMHGATFLDAEDRVAAPGDPLERRPLLRRMRRTGAARARFSPPRAAIWRCPASPRRRCSGSPSTSRRCSRRRRACCCRRILSGCVSAARRCRKCPTPRERSGSTSPSEAGTTISSPRPA